MIRTHVYICPKPVAGMKPLQIATDTGSDENRGGGTLSRLRRGREVIGRSRPPGARLECQRVRGAGRGALLDRVP